MRPALSLAKQWALSLVAINFVCLISICIVAFLSGGRAAGFVALLTIILLPCLSLSAYRMTFRAERGGSPNMNLEIAEPMAPLAIALFFGFMFF